MIYNATNNIFIALAESISTRSRLLMGKSSSSSSLSASNDSSSSSTSLFLIDYKPCSTRSIRFENLKLERENNLTRLVYLKCTFLYCYHNNILLPLALTVHLDKITSVNRQIIFIFIKRLIIFDNKFIIFIRETGRIENFSFFERFLPFHPPYDYSSIRNSSRWTEV